VTLDLHFPKVAAEYRQMAEREMQRLPAPENSETVYSCGGGVNSFAVDPYGNMSICVLSHRDTYNIRSGSVKEGWEKFRLLFRTKERKKISKCVNCRLHSLCSMCPANGELENGDPESPVEFLCQVAHLRAMALGLQVPSHGDCDFCVGGSRHAGALEATQRIVSKEIDVGEWISPQVLLPVLNNQGPSSGGGCAGCGGQSLR